MKRSIKRTGYIIVNTILLLVILTVNVSAQPGQTQADKSIYIPIVKNGDVSGHIISGQVLSPQNTPLSGVTLRTDKGQEAVTDQYGNYSLTVTNDGVYTLTPSLGEVAFSPPTSSVFVPPDVSKLNFTAQLACTEAVVNGGFENNTGWELPVTEYTAGYTTLEAHSGSRSMRTGIVYPADNKYSYSSAQQKVIIPAGTTSASLTFWIKPFSGGTQSLALAPSPQIGASADEAQLAGDVQYVLVLDSSKKIVKTLIWQLSNSRTWTQYQFSLAAFTGQTIWLHFGSYNDGLDGIASLFVDDVSLSICPGGTPTPPPSPGPCTNLFKNPGFEAKTDWEIPITAYPAGYSTVQAHTGSWSMRTGILKLSDNIFSYSDFRQAVKIPAGAAIAMARFWLYPLSGDTNVLSEPPMITPTGRPFSETQLSGDLQYVLVLDQYQNWIDTLVWQRSDLGYWKYYEFDLRRYSGRTIYLQFGTYNDGFSGITSMFVDDVSLDDCVVTPTPTTTPGPCTELIVNKNFEASTGWEIINTAYPAGYSNAHYYSPVRSMRTGITLPGDNTFSYSDFRQVVTIPSTANHTTLTMWLYPISSETLALELPPEPAPGVPLGEAQLSSDVQYMLVMNSNFQIIKTLVWQRSNSQAWTKLQFDLSLYKGWTLLLQWGTYNNGIDGITSMFVDDVTLQACP